MHWIVLLISAVFEAIWATALGESEGFSRLQPTIIFLIALAISMAGLAYAMKKIPIGTAYAIWTGIGSALTVTIAMVTGNESFEVAKVIFLIGIIGATVGLKLVSSDDEDETEKA